MFLAGGETPLHVAVTNRQKLQCAELLLESRAAVDAKTKCMFFPSFAIFLKSVLTSSWQNTPLPCCLDEGERKTPPDVVGQGSERQLCR